MKPELMALLLRETRDAYDANVSALAVWEHHGVGAKEDRDHMRAVIVSLSREYDRLQANLAARLGV